MNESMKEANRTIADMANEAKSQMVEAGGKHYGQGLQPWDLQRHMETWGSVFIDGRRTDIMEYVFRTKGDIHKQLDDVRKAKHNCEEIIKELEEKIKDIGQNFLDDTECIVR